MNGGRLFKRCALGALLASPVRLLAAITLQPDSGNKYRLAETGELGEGRTGMGSSGNSPLDLSQGCPLQTGHGLPYSLLMNQAGLSHFDLLQGPGGNVSVQIPGSMFPKASEDPLFSFQVHWLIFTLLCFLILSSPILSLHPLFSQSHQIPVSPPRTSLSHRV